MAEVPKIKIGNPADVVQNTADVKPGQGQGATNVPKAPATDTFVSTGSNAPLSDPRGPAFSIVSDFIKAKDLKGDLEKDIREITGTA